MARRTASEPLLYDCGARNATIDCVKGLAIFLVVWGHCIQYLLIDPRNSYFQNPLFQFIYSFHMPLFMAVSGYLFAISEQTHSSADLLIKRAKRLLLPAAVWSVVASTGAWITGWANGHATGFRLQNTLWFLTAIMFCVVVAVLCDKIGRGHPSVYALAILLSLALPDRFGLTYDKFMLPYFVAGLLWFRHSRKLAPSLYKVAWILSALTLWVLLAHWTTDYYVYTTGMSLAVPDPQHKLFILAYRFLAGFAGVICVVATIYFLQPYVMLRPMMYLGQYTMGIYALSIQLNPLLYHLRIPFFSFFVYDWITTPVLAVVLCIVCICAVKIMKINKWASNALLGA